MRYSINCKQQRKIVFIVVRFCSEIIFVQSKLAKSYPMLKVPRSEMIFEIFPFAVSPKNGLEQAI